MNKAIYNIQKIKKKINYREADQNSEYSCENCKFCDKTEDLMSSSINLSCHNANFGWRFRVGNMTICDSHEDKDSRARVKNQGLKSFVDSCSNYFK